MRIIPSLVLVFILSMHAQSQDQTPLTALQSAASSSDSAKTLKTDSTAIDTLGRMSTPSLVGTFDRSLDSSRFVTRDQLHWLDYRYLGGILESFPGVFIRDLNGAGQYNQLNIQGVDWRSIAIASNGRPLNDPASGIYNLFQFTTEYADRVEVISGPRAFLYGLNATGGAVNLVTKNYNSNRPYTKLNYSEAGYDYAYSDGTFSQNITRKVNFTFGFQHQGTTGRYPNEAHEAWNMRVKLRYNLSKDLNIIASEYLTSSETRLNGGVNRQLSTAPFDPRLATVVNYDAYDKITRHDADLSLVGTLLGDTSNVTMLTLYYSHNLREYRDEEESSRPNGVFIQSDHVSSWTGAIFTQNLDTKLQRLTLGASAEVRQVEGSPNIGRRRNLVASAWGKEEILIGEPLVVAGFGRVDRYRKQNYLGAGADATLRVSPGISLFGGMSFSNRVPNYTELFWSDSTAFRPAAIVAEKHRQVEAGVTLSIPGGSSLRAAYFHRTILDPITVLPFRETAAFTGVEFVNGPNLAVNGFEGRVEARVGFVAVEATGTWLVQRTDGNTLSRYPRLSARGGIYYWNSILHDHLQLKTGFRGHYQSREQGERFNPEVIAYFDNTGEQLGYGSAVDFVLIGHIGDAYLHFIWENLTGVSYYSTPDYPVLDRMLRFGVSWEFSN